MEVKFEYYKQDSININPFNSPSEEQIDKHNQRKAFLKMAQFSQCIPIADIKEETPRSEQITVRIMRLWYKRSESRPNDVQGVELILIDANGDTIQATINKRLARLFLEQLNEGNTYKIRRFSISSNRVGLDMATFHPCKIWFEYSTKVVPITNEGIPLSVHVFYTFHEVFFGVMPDRLYINVIGRLEHIYPIKDSNGKKRRTIVLGNHENQLLSCSVFGDYVDQIENIEKEYVNQKKPTLVMLFVKRSVYEGEVSITTTWGTTKILVNPSMDEVTEFNNRFPEGDENVFGAAQPVGYHPPILASANIKLLSELTKLTKGGVYVTMAQFLELDTSGNSWFYNSCKKCRAKVKQGEDGLWYCGKERGGNPYTMKGLGMPSAIPRFQVKFFVTYENSTLLEFIIWDDVMTELLGKTAQAILDEDDIYKLIPPPDFRPLLERTFVAKIRVTQVYNIEQKSNSYGVINLCDDPKTISKWNALNDARKEQEFSTSSRDTTKTGSMMEQLRKINESEPVLNSGEITPQNGVVLMAEVPDKSSATKHHEIKMGKKPMKF